MPKPDKAHKPHKKHKKKRRPYDPLAAIRPGQLRNEAVGVVRAGTAPLIAQTIRQFQQEAEAGGRSITGYTDFFAKQLADQAGKVGGIYDQARAQQQSADSGLLALLGHRGDALEGELGGSLTKMGQDPAGAAGVNALEGGIVGMSGALGQSTMSRLIGQGAAARTQAEAQPGIAALGGLQSIRQLNAQLNKQREDQLGEIRASVPGSIASLYQQLMDRELNKGIARQGFQTDMGNLALEGQQQSQQNQQFYDSLAQDQGQFNASLAADTVGGLADQAKDHRTAINAAKKSARATALSFAKSLIKSGGGSNPFSGGGGAKRPPWAVAFRRTRQAIAGELRQHGVRPAVINQIVRNALLAQGWKAPKKLDVPSGAFGPGGPGQLH